MRHLGPTDNRVRSGEASQRVQLGLLGDHVPTADDLSPVGIAAEGASVKVRHIKVLRDVYYIAAFNKGEPRIRQIPIDFSISRLASRSDQPRELGL